ncbi:MAG: hypothetical protein ACKVP1_09985 [Burkholderiaceae bacterium]
MVLNLQFNDRRERLGELVHHPLHGRFLLHAGGIEPMVKMAFSVKQRNDDER